MSARDLGSLHLSSAEGSLRYLTDAGVTGRNVRPGKERQDGSGRTRIVTKIDVIRTRVITIFRALDESQSEHLGIEVQVSLRSEAIAVTWWSPTKGLSICCLSSIRFIYYESY